MTFVVKERSKSMKYQISHNFLDDKWYIQFIESGCVVAEYPLGEEQEHE